MTQPSLKHVRAELRKLYGDGSDHKPGVETEHFEYQVNKTLEMFDEAVANAKKELKKQHLRRTTPRR